MKNLVTMAMMFAIAFGSMAQEQRGQRQGPPDEKMMEKIKSDLNLSDDQFEDWKAIHQKYGNQLKELSKKRQDEEEELKALMHKDIEAILSDEQLAKFAEIRKLRDERKMNGQHDQNFAMK